jgi:hypothetical protein
MLTFFGFSEQDYIDNFWNDYVHYFQKLTNDEGAYIVGQYARAIKMKGSKIVEHGLSAKFLESLKIPFQEYPHSYYDKKMDVVTYTKEQARELYFRFFFNPAYLKMRDKNLSGLLFKFGVQVGRHDAVKMLQEAINRVIRTKLLIITGTFSIDTLKASNEIFNPNVLYDMYVVMISQYKETIKPGSITQLIRAVKNLF